MERKISNENSDLEIHDFFDSPPKLLSLSNIPSQTVHNYLIGDVLRMLRGQHGKYYMKAEPVHCDHEIRKFTFSNDMDKWMKNFLVERILPIVSEYSTMTRLILKYENSNVVVVNDFIGVLKRFLETRYKETLRSVEEKCNQKKIRLVYAIENELLDIRDEMHFFSDIVQDAFNGDDLHPVVILNILYKKNSLYLRDGERILLNEMMTRCANNYFELLDMWIHRGTLADGPGLFMIRRNESDVWNEKFAIRENFVPCFLANVEHYILKTGAYIFTMKSCDEEYAKNNMKMRCPTIISKIEDIAEVQNKISECFEDTALSFLEFVNSKYHVARDLSFVKDIFLNRRGHVISSFLEMLSSLMKGAEHELTQSDVTQLMKKAMKHSEVWNASRLQISMHIRILDFVSVVRSEFEFKRGNVDFGKLPKVDRINYILDRITLRVRSIWPLNVIAQDESFQKLERVLEYIFKWKFLEKRLCDLWILEKRVGNIRCVDFRLHFASSRLRDTMLKYAQHFLYYICQCCADLEWKNFSDKAEQVKDVESLAQEFKKFSVSCWKDCFLNNEVLFHHFLSTLQCCHNFCALMEAFYRSITDITSCYENCENYLNGIRKKICLFECEFFAIYDAIRHYLENAKNEEISEYFFRFFWNRLPQYFVYHPTHECQITADECSSNTLYVNIR